ncbi:MAG: NUDIX hydrolase [Chloroflexota bacterium]|nr:NUDIX hydrolase [Chloroflexota bacterium]
MNEVQFIRRRDVCGVILYSDDGRVLLQQRDDKPTIPYPGCWTFFGGALEAGETADEAIQRELMEELTLEQTLTFWYDYECPVRTIPGEVVTRNFMYVGRLTRSLDSLVLLEGQAMKLFTAEESEEHELAYAQSPILRKFFADKVMETLP